MADSQKLPLAKLPLTLAGFEKTVFFHKSFLPQNFPVFSGGIHKPELCCNRQGVT